MLEQSGQRQAAPVRAVADAAQLGVQDIVLLAVKAHSLTDILPLVRPLLGPRTLIVPAVNGVPWWFTAPDSGQPMKSIDPEGAIAAAIPAHQVLGAVVYPACSRPEPGWSRHGGSDARGWSGRRGDCGGCCGCPLALPRWR